DLEAEKSAPVATSCKALRASLDPSCQPAGFIFHMSRCGSTLLSQMLKEISGVRVYSEPAAVNEALLLSPQLRRATLRSLVDTVVRAFCSRSARVFFKCSSWNVLDYALFDELFPLAPKLF